MSSLTRLLSELAAVPIGGYVSNGPAYAEPTALAALALLGHGYPKPARTAANWLMRMQADDGSVGICPDHPTPRWPTALAVLAWTAIAGTTQYERTSEPPEMHIQGAVRWILSAKGQSISGDAQPSVVDEMLTRREAVKQSLEVKLQEQPRNRHGHTEAHQQQVVVHPGHVVDSSCISNLYAAVGMCQGV